MHDKSGACNSGIWAVQVGGFRVQSHPLIYNEYETSLGSARFYFSDVNSQTSGYSDAVAKEIVAFDSFGLKGLEM